MIQEDRISSTSSFTVLEKKFAKNPEKDLSAVPATASDKKIIKSAFTIIFFIKKSHKAADAP